MDFIAFSDHPETCLFSATDTVMTFVYGFLEDEWFTMIWFTVLEYTQESDFFGRLCHHWDHLWVPIYVTDCRNTSDCYKEQNKEGEIMS